MPELQFHCGSGIYVYRFFTFKISKGGTALSMHQKIIMPLILLLVLIFSTPAYTQSADWNSIEMRFEQAKKLNEIDELADFIKTNFETDQQQAAAIYWWLGKHIRYDASTALRQARISYKTQQKITNEAFRSRKAVCEGYAGIMDSIFHLLDIPSYIISGYTLQGNEISAIPHAWNAAKIAGRWQFFDPTWASGFLNGRRFEAQFNESYYGLSATEIRKTHIPYDPIWQFSSDPISHQEFITGKISSTPSGQNFVYADSIRGFLNLSPEQQLSAEYKRIMRYYYPHEALKNRLDFLRSNLEIAQHNQQVNQLNQATSYYNEAVVAFNNYVNLQRQNPAGNRAAKELQLKKSANEVAKSQQLLPSGKAIPAELKSMANQLQKSVKNLKKQLEAEGVVFQ